MPYDGSGSGLKEKPPLHRKMFVRFEWNGDRDLKKSRQKKFHLWFSQLPCFLQEWCQRIEFPNTMSAFFHTSSQQTDSKQPHKALLIGYLGAKKANQKIRTAASYKSPGGPSPCLLHSSLRCSSLSGSPKVPAARVNLRTGLPDRGAALPVFSAWLRMTEWVSEHSWEGVKEKGKEGREVRFEEGDGENSCTHARTHTRMHTSPEHCNGNNGQISLWRLWLERAAGLSQGMTPQGKQWTVPFTLQWFFTNCWSKAVSSKVMDYLLS